MNTEQMLNEIEKIDQQIKDLKENRCDSVVCINNGYERSLKIQDLLDKRTELYYELNRSNEGKTKATKQTCEEKARQQEKIAIAKNLLDVLNDEMISTRTGLTVEDVQALRN